MMELESDLLIKLLFIAGIVFWFWIWSFWTDLQDTYEFHPDGLKGCPPETYTILEDDSRNSSKVRCVSCPVCPAGEEPLPPCGTTLAVKTPGECTLCKPGTYSDGFDSAACKACTDCGSRNVKASCTAEKNAKCEDCPWRYYEDDTTQICKHCSSCCGRNSPAEMECFLTKKCRGRCTRTTKMKYLSSMFNRMVEKSRSGSQNTTSILNGTDLQKDNQKNSKSVLDSVVNTEDGRIIRSEIKRDVRIQNGIQEDYKDSPNGQLQTAGQVIEKKELEDIDVLEIPDILRNFKEQADIPGTKQDPSPTKNNFKGLKDTNTNAFENEELSIHPQALPDKNQFTIQQTVSTPATTENTLDQLTPHSSVILTTTAQTQLINPSSFISSFAGTTAAVLVIGLIGLIIYMVFKKCVHKVPRGYKKLRDSPEPGEQLKDPFDEISEKEDREFSGDDTMNNEHRDETAVATVLEDLNLSEIPPDLENILIMSLDVPHKAGNRSSQEEFGWHKVGTAAGISRRELNYYQYSRQQSPTKLLLDKLGSQGRTISYLIDVLQKPRVELGNVAKNIIRHRATRI